MKQIIAIILFCCYASLAQGQGCQVTTNASLGLPNYVILFPNEVNGATGTVSVTANGGTASHTLSETLGTSMVFNIASTNGSYAQAYITQGSYTGPLETWPLNGAMSWTSQSWAMGSPVTWHYLVNGVEQDRVTVSTYDNSSGPPGTIMFQDDFPTNYYLQLSDPFNGGTSMNEGTCQGASQAHHTAFYSGSFTNPTSGETQSFNTNNNFCPNCTFNEGVPPLYIPWLPKDAPPKTTTNGKLECTIAGNFLGLLRETGDSTKNQRIDKKMWTKVKIASSVQAGDGGWYVDVWCEEYPPTLPIWAPNEIYTELAPLNQYYWTAQTCSSSPPGTDPGPGWHCPEVSGGPGPMKPEKFFPSFSGVKGSCNTNVNTPAPY